MPLLSKVCRQFDHTVISIKPHYISGSFKYGGAVLATANVIFNRLTQFGREIAIQVVGNLLPHLCAIHYHGFSPF